MAKLKNLITSNAPLKIVSCILGYTFWFIFGHAQTIKTELTVPLCFYGAAQNVSIQAPETVHIELSGKRTIMQSLELENIAVHVNAQEFAIGSHPIAITQESLFLPDSIKLIHYSPAHIIVTVQHNQSMQESTQV